jgi:hypothetical protein
MKKLLMRTLCGSVLALGLSMACGSDDDGDKGGSDEASLVGDCKVISDACHSHDEGDGEVSECHELAHDNNNAKCTPKKAACVAACKK